MSNEIPSLLLRCPEGKKQNEVYAASPSCPDATRWLSKLVWESPKVPETEEEKMKREMEERWEAFKLQKQKEEEEQAVKKAQDEARDKDDEAKSKGPDQPTDADRAKQSAEMEAEKIKQQEAEQKAKDEAAKEAEEKEKAAFIAAETAKLDDVKKQPEASDNSTFHEGC